MINSVTYTTFIFNKLLPACVVFFVGWFLAGKLTAIINKAMTKSKMEESMISFSNSVLKVTFRSIVILMVMACFGINISSIIAALGAALVTVGLALKDNLSNVASGVLIIINKPFKIGDFLETSSVRGKVTKIEMLSTTLVTPDNREIVMPNSKLTADYVINSSANSQRRLDVVVPIKKDSNFSEIQQILNEIIKSDERILECPEPNVTISNFSESTVDIIIKVWCEAINYDSLSKSLHEGIKNEFDKNNVAF